MGSPLCRFFRHENVTRYNLANSGLNRGMDMQEAASYFEWGVRGALDLLPVCPTSAILAPDDALEDEADHCELEGRKAAVGVFRGDPLYLKEASRKYGYSKWKYAKLLWECKLKAAEVKRETAQSLGYDSWEELNRLAPLDVRIPEI